MKKIKTNVGNVKFPQLTKLWRVMKITGLFLLVALLQVTASTYSQSTKLTFDFDNGTMSSFFKTVEANSEFRFFYDSKQIDVSEKVSVKAKNSNIADVLNQLFENSNISYEIIDRHVILKNIDKADGRDTNFSNQQQKSVSGTVKDESGQPLPGVTVIVKGTINGTVTNMDGQYSLGSIPENPTLQFSFVGMKTQEISIGNKTQVNVTMEEENIGIEEIVTIGYGTRSKRDVTTAISTVTADKIAKVVPSSPELLMQGQMSGVQIIGNQGNPNARPTVRIRGTNTFGISDPLYVIDGIPIKEYGAGIEGARDQYTRGGINVLAFNNASILILCSAVI